MHVHGRAGKPKQLARYAKNPGKTFGFAAERTGTEHFAVFPMVLREFERCLKRRSRLLHGRD
jgi:hypothetical protein